MIRINRKNTEKARLAIADLQKARKSGKTYNTKSVNAALVETFHGKCYICENNKAVENTILLLNNVYYGTTPQKEFEARVIRKELRKELTQFKEYVREYQEAEDEDEKEDVELLIKRELKDSSAFTAFKRWLIWDNRIYSELEKYIPEAKAPSIGKNEY